MGTFVLKNKNYFLLFVGSVVSNLGTHIYNFAMSLYILKLTDNNAGIAGAYMAFGGLVFFALSLFGGAIVDRLDKVNVVYITDFLNGIAILIAGYIIFSDLSVTNIIIVLFISSFVLGVNSALFNPAARSLPAHILEPEQLQQSSSLQQGFGAIYGIVGAALGGVLYSFVDIEYIFWINGISFILSGISERFITTKTKADESHVLTFKGTLIDIKEGFKYILNLRPILALVIIAAFLNFFTVPVIANGLPYLFEAELEVDAYYYGILQSAFPIGVIVSSALLGMRAQREKVSPLIVFGLFGMAFAFTFLTASTYLHLGDHINFLWFMTISVIAIVITGFFNGFINVPFSVAIMRQVDKSKLGRVFSVVAIISNGLTPIAIGLGGLAITYLGLMNLFYCAVVAMFITSFLALTNKNVQQL